MPVGRTGSSALPLRTLLGPLATLTRERAKRPAESGAGRFEGSFPPQWRSKKAGGYATRSSRELAEESRSKSSERMMASASARMGRRKRRL